jgi:hypothetical protein
MLSVSRRIAFALDNFNARVHQKSGNGLEADVHLVRTCTPLSSYKYIFYMGGSMCRKAQLNGAANVDANNRLHTKSSVQRTSDLRKRNIVRTIILILVLLTIRKSAMMNEVDYMYPPM